MIVRPGKSAPSLDVAGDDYLFFVGRAVLGMREIVVSLGDSRAAMCPDRPGANAPYGLLVHCLGVIEYWAGRCVAGREISRDREAEFAATGSVQELSTRVELQLARLGEDLEMLDPAAPLRHAPDAWAEGPERELSQSAALIHLYEEVAQHHGQMEQIRDDLFANYARNDRARNGGAREDEAGGGEAPDFDDISLAWLRAKRGVKWHRPGPTLLPAWVADMDFPVAPPIRRAIDATLERGDLGYPDWHGHPLAEAFGDRMRRGHGWNPDPGHVRGVTDLIQALQIVLGNASAPGDAVIAHTPNYPPFLATAQTMGRELLQAQMRHDGADSWTWDHDLLERQAAGQKVKILLLVNPHNPTGRVFIREELTCLAELAERHDLTVVADEIHSELIHTPHRHTPFASISEDAARRTVTVTSATKTFNIAGLRTAVAHVGPPELRAAWDRQPPDLYGATNVLGVEATKAAWADGDTWLETLNRHLLGQRDYLAERLRESPVDFRPPEAGYLAWLDFGRAGIGDDPAAWLREHAGVELSSGLDFGPGNDGYARLNFGTSRSILDKMIEQILTSLPTRPRIRVDDPSQTSPIPHSGIQIALNTPEPTP